MASLSTLVLALFAFLALAAAALVALLAVGSRIAYGPISIRAHVAHTIADTSADVAKVARFVARASAALAATTEVASASRCETLAVDMSTVLDAGPTRGTPAVAAKVAATDADTDAAQTARYAAVAEPVAPATPLWRQVGNAIIYLG